LRLERGGEAATGVRGSAATAGQHGKVHRLAMIAAIWRNERIVG
jgi:hypothetical protein